MMGFTPVVAAEPFPATRRAYGVRLFGLLKITVGLGLKWFGWLLGWFERTLAGGDVVVPGGASFRRRRRSRRRCLFFLSFVLSVFTSSLFFYLSSLVYIPTPIF